MTSTTPPKPQKNIIKKIVKKITISLVIFIISLISFTAWLLNTQSGLHFAFYQLPKLGNINIQSQSLKGTLWQGFEAHDINIQSKQSHIHISHLHFAWQPQQLFQKHLHIKHLNIGEINITSQSSASKTQTEPSKLPENLSLPLTINLDKLSIGKINQLNKKQEKTELVQSLLANYQYNQQEHKITIQSLRNTWSESEGAIILENHTPFTLRGVLISNGELDGININNNLILSGSLENIKIFNTLAGNGIELYADTNFHPFAQLLNQKIGSITLKGEGINPHAFLPTLPQAKLTFNVNIQSENQNQALLLGTLSLHNDHPKASNQNGIPIQQLIGNIHINEQGNIDIQQFETTFMHQGKLNLNGEINPNQHTLNLTAQLNQITSKDLISNPLTGILNGKIHVHNSFSHPKIDWQLDTGRATLSGNLSIPSDPQHAQRTLQLEHIQIQAHQGGNINLSGSYELFDQQKLQLNIASQQFNPQRFYPTFPEGNINSNIQINGIIAQQEFSAEILFNPSQLSGAPLTGNGKFHYQQQHITQADSHISLGQNNIRTQGAFGKTGDILNLDIHAPELNRFGFGIQGVLTTKGSIQTLSDDWKKLDIKLTGNAKQFALNKLIRIQNLDFTILASPAVERPLNIQITGQNILANNLDIHRLDTQMKGTLRQHTFQTNSNLKLDNKPLTVNIQATGGLNEQQRWQGNINLLDITGALNLKLQNPIHLIASKEYIELSKANWQALKGSLNLEHFTWHAQNGLSSKGVANNLHLEELHQFYTPPIQHNLVLAGDWDFTYNQAPKGYLNIHQQSGDIILSANRTAPLGLNQLSVKTQFNQRGIFNTLHSNTRYGNINGQINILQTLGNNLMQAPLNGQITIQSENLDTLRSFMPIGQSISGTLLANINLQGQLNNPQLSGHITGSQLNYHNREIGIFLNNGTLKSHLEGQRWIIDQLTFQRKEGQLNLIGEASYTDDTPRVNAQINFNHYPILDQPNRRLAISGETLIMYNPQGLHLTGSLKTNEGKFGFQDNSAPSLDDDVQILGENNQKQATTFPLNIDIGFDLNDQVQFSGQGLNVTLGGQLQLKTLVGSNLDAIGSINIIKGSYKAYGQDLIISKGIISFVGPLNNPNLNIRAERRNSQVGAGVEVLGNLENPRITLVANEPMSEKDKLSWLILNRASSGSSTDEAALATAVGAFLAGSINDKIGLVDNFGLTSQQTRNAQTGEMNPAQQVLTFGKQLTQNLYLGYEAGLQTASQSVKFVYTLSRSLQLIIRAGTESSGGEIKYIKRFD